jgi:hypothetical protein
MKPVQSKGAGTLSPALNITKESDMKSKTQKVREYFRKHPLATPKEVGAKFDCAMPVVYKIRKEEQADFIERSNAPIIERGYTHPREEFKPSKHADGLQVGGDHYKNMGVQPWKAMESWFSPAEFQGFLKGNAIKYLARCNSKGGLEDVKKAQHYIAKLIEVSE